MNIEVNGVKITLTDQQLKEIAKQTQKPNWRDKIKIGNFHWRLGNDDREGFIKPLSILTAVKHFYPEMLFTNEGHVELVAKKCNLMIEMHNFAHAMNEGWVPDWRDEDEIEFGIATTKGEVEAMKAYNPNGFCFGIAVKSKEIAEQMLEEFGERIKEVYNTQY